MTNQDEAIVIDTPEGIAFFHALQLKHALSLSMKGINVARGSLINQVNREYGTTFRTKAQAYEHMCDVVEIQLNLRGRRG